MVNVDTARGGDHAVLIQAEKLARAAGAVDTFIYGNCAPLLCDRLEVMQQRIGENRIGQARLWADIEAIDAVLGNETDQVQLGQRTVEAFRYMISLRVVQGYRCE